MTEVEVNKPLTPNQLRQLEKQARKKKYADLAIQGTNNSSIASKRSVERLYLTKLGVNANVDSTKPSNEYFKYFVRKPLRRSPCINRGYWLRLEAVKSRVDSIVEHTAGRVVVVNLGCGYDPLPFQLLDPNNLQNTRYNGRLSFVDIDYADLISTKINIIKQTDELKNIVGQETHTDKVLFQTPKYVATSCNLNESEKFNKLMEDLNLNDPDIVKVFVAEVSLAYMKPELADKVISLTSRLQNSHFVILEQLLPVGEGEPFSRQMLKHFRKNDSPLLSVNAYHTIESHIERFKKAGYANVNAGDMFQLWDLLPEETKLKVESIEGFDELEEFFLFCHHYIICHSTNSNSFEFADKYRFRKREELGEYQVIQKPMKVIEVEGKSLLKRKFGASALLPSDEIIYTFGCFNSRLHTTLSLSTGVTHSAIDSSRIPQERMCHTFTYVDDNTCILAGGRTAPNKTLEDVWILTRKQSEGAWEWQQGLNLPDPRFRHGACLLNEHQLLIYGGKTRGSTFLVYDMRKNEIKQPKVLGSISCRASAALCFNIPSQTGAIFGGLKENGTIDGTLTTFKYDSEANTLTIEKTSRSPLFKRYGAKAVFTDMDTLLLVGGTSPDRLFGQTTTIVEINVGTRVTSLVEIPKELWMNDSLMLVGFELQMLNSGDILCFGGGAVCYGFGAVWNKILKVGSGNAISEIEVNVVQ